jgi:hypothetical protein
VWGWTSGRKMQSRLQPPSQDQPREGGWGHRVTYLCLGEYSALVAAGALSFSDGLKMGGRVCEGCVKGKGRRHKSCFERLIMQCK